MPFPDWTDWLSRLPEFLKSSWSELSKVFIGAFFVCFLAFNWVRSIRKTTKAQIRAEKSKLDAQLSEKEAIYQKQHAQYVTKAQEHFAGLKVRMAEQRSDMQREQMGLQEKLRQTEEHRDRLQTELHKFQKQWNDLEAFDGKLWQRDNITPPPAFINMRERRCRFISIMNLKGGVGKTTLTANVGVALARKGYRVLLVDLDFQGSLTRLCLSQANVDATAAKGHFSDRFLSPIGAAGFPKPHELAQPIETEFVERGVCHIIGAYDWLAEAELRAQARWLVSQTPDARYLFRQAFHCAEFADRYDYVLFDCPPRLTTACINALACSDYLLVPVLLERGSVAALPHTLGWFKQLPHVAQTRLLGVVANRAEYHGDKLIAAQQTIFNYLPEQIERSGFDKRDVFQTVVRNNRSKIESAANEGRIAAATDDGLALFQPIVDEIEKGVLK